MAVKLFRLDLPPERVHQLVAEFERLIAAGQTHAGMVAPLATGMHEVAAYLAQDYVVADSLDIAVREHGPADPSDALRIAAQLARALDAAAAADIDHGALHPRDILLADDEARLTGLGIARALERVGVSTPARRPYTAPERIAGSRWDRRADVFGLAALMHELLWARRVAGWGDEAAGSLTDIAGADLSLLRAAFAQALAEDPAGRFDTALDFVEALDRACLNMTITSSPRDPERPAAATPREQELRLPLDGPIERPRQTTDGDLPEIDFDIGHDAHADLPLPSALAESGDPAGAALLFRETRDQATNVPGNFGSLSDAGSPAAALSRPTEGPRSAISPLAFALVIGATVGFAAGYGVGTSDRSAAPSATSVSQVLPPGAPVAPASTPDVRQDLTEGLPVTPRALEPLADRQPSNLGVQPQPEAVPKSKSDPQNTPKPDVAKQTTPALGRAALAANLVVRSTPIGARVFVDGRDYGRTPVTVRDLARGPHRVRVTSEGFTTDERRVTIGASDSARALTVRLSPLKPAAPVTAARSASPSGTTATSGRATAPLTVESRPSGANVFLDGRLVGKTPLSLSQVAAGEHDIRLEHDGYKPWSSPIRIVASEPNRATASLER